MNRALMTLLASLLLVACNGMLKQGALYQEQQNPTPQKPVVEDKVEDTLVFFTWYHNTPKACAARAQEEAADAVLVDCYHSESQTTQEWIEGTLLVPLACTTSAGLHAINSAPCAGLVNRDTAVQGLSGATYTLDLWLPSVCEADGGHQMGYTSKDTQPKPDSMAVWPAEAASRVQSIPRIGNGSDALTTEDVEALNLLVLGESYGGPQGLHITIKQVTAVDLDGSGADDHMVSIETTHGTTGEPYTALLMRRDGGSWSKLYESDFEQFTVMAISDLDGDGAFEILLQNAYHEGTYFTFQRWKNGAFEALGTVGCGA